MQQRIFTPAEQSVRVVGYLALACSICLSGLFLANLHSRFKYDAPNFSFLGYIAIYGFLVGIGLLRFRRWAWLLLAIPLSLYGAVLCILSVRAQPSLTNAIIGITWAVAMSIPALFTSRFWKTLR